MTVGQTLSALAVAFTLWPVIFWALLAVVALMIFGRG